MYMCLTKTAQLYKMNRNSQPKNFIILQVYRWKASNATKVAINRPNLIKAYNNGMGGVDLADQNLATYRISLKTTKWYRKFLYHLLDMCVVNAFAAWKADFPEDTTDFLEFKVFIFHKPNRPNLHVEIYIYYFRIYARSMEPGAHLKKMSSRLQEKPILYNYI